MRSFQTRILLLITRVLLSIYWAQENSDAQRYQQFEAELQEIEDSLTD